MSELAGLTLEVREHGRVRFEDKYLSAGQHRKVDAPELTQRGGVEIWRGCDAGMRLSDLTR